MKRLRRSLSEPPRNEVSLNASTIFRIDSSSISREIKRSTSITFEQVKDQFAASINEWSTKEICSVLLGLVQRCNFHQMRFLWTSLESIPHKDFLHRATRKYPTVSFQPLSTPISREIKTKLQRSRYPENKSLYRTQSILITHSVPLSTYSVTEATSLAILPGLRPSTAPEPPIIPVEETDDSIRLCSPRRRHMTISLSKPGTPSCYRLPAVRTDAWSGNDYSQTDNHQTDVCSRSLPFNGRPFLKWFSNLEKDWQQQEILQLVIWSLNQKELYYLAILLLSRQYKDFTGDLPLTLSLQILSHVSGKDILVACQVSQRWYERCTDETLWKIKCEQIQLGLPSVIQTTWKKLFIDNIKLKRNWRLGRAQTVSITKHKNRVLCVTIKQDEGICATGSKDQTIQLWRLRDGRLINTINEHSRVWSLCFYGLNFLISGCSDGNVKIWHIRTGKHVKILERHKETIWALKQKGDKLITGSNDKTAILWNIRQCKYNRQLIGHRGAVFGVDLSDDCKRAFSAGGDKTVRIWNTDNGECVKVIRGCESILSIHYSKSYIAFSAGSCVYLWSLDNNRLVYKFKGHKERVEAVNLQITGSNSNTIVSCGKDGLIKYWNTKTGHCIRTLGPLASSINSVDRDSTRIVSASDDKSITIWDFNPLSHLNDSRPTTTTTATSLKNNKSLTASINMSNFDIF